MRLTQSEIEAYLDEDLSPEEMAEIEEGLRNDPKMLEILAQLNSRRDAGLHSLGAMWRMNRISCPTREQLGSHLLGALSEDLSDYVTFHVQKVGCRVCRANLEDLNRQQEESTEVAGSRRRKYFESSAGYFRRKD